MPMGVQSFVIAGSLCFLCCLTVAKTQDIFFSFGKILVINLGNPRLGTTNVKYRAISGPPDRIVKPWQQLVFADADEIWIYERERKMVAFQNKRVKFITSLR